MYTKEVYTEVFAIVKKLGIEYEKKVPKKIWDIILKNKSNDYMPQYNDYIELSNDKIKKESLNIIAFLDLNYWCNKEEAYNIKKIFYEKEIKEEEEKRKKYNPDIIFKKTKYQEIQVVQFPVEYKKQNFFTNLFNRIKLYIMYRKKR